MTEATSSYLNRKRRSLADVLAEREQETKMQTKEYRTLDKSAWPRGPWDAEPDKKQWQDEATGLPCLAVRGPGGHWCGYVGVAPEHPWHGKGYGQCVEPAAHEAGDSDWHYNCTPGGIVSAHGGLTFAGGCAKTGEDEWRRAQKHRADYEREAVKYPRGDAAQWLAEWAPVLNDYPAWRERQQAVSVCHLPAPGKPDSVWWFGFDCAHCDDYAPKYDRKGSMRRGVYRSLAYVEDQCRHLAEQLAAVCHGTGRAPQARE